MAAADTAKLVASLTLDAKGFTAGAAKAQNAIGKLEGSLGDIGRKAGQGLASFTKNVALIGVAATGVVAVAVKGGLQDLATLESKITAVDGAIEQMGQTGEITGKQVAQWANDIERNIDAAFDDKDITQAAATLIRFGKVVPANLKEALEVTADLAVRTGDVESASELLAKALVDPAKAAGKLARAGIVLTKAQQETIKAMVAQNDIAGAQKLILDEVAKTTEGAAAASQGKYADALNKLNDIAEDARKALAEGFLPVIERVADLLSTKLADPKFMQGLREFGTTLAAGLDDLIDVALKLPWSTIGESLRIAGAGAKVVLEAFTSLPPWIQTAVITGWGLNKLTGGALGGIVKDLASGLIKGVLGINAGHVTVNAATVSGVGAGAPGAVPAGGKGGALLNAATKVFIVGAAAGIFLEAFNASGLFDPTHRDSTGKVARTTNDPTQRLIDLEASQKVLLERANGGDTDAARKLRQINAEIIALRGEQVAQTQITQQAAFAVRDAVNTKGSTLASVMSGPVVAAVNAAGVVARQGGQQAAFAIRDKDLSVSVANTVNVSTSVSVRETIKTQTTNKQFSRYIQ